MCANIRVGSSKLEEVVDNVIDLSYITGVETLCLSPSGMTSEEYVKGYYRGRSIVTVRQEAEHPSSMQV